jgi:hypothetical protein
MRTALLIGSAVALAAAFALGTRVGGVSERVVIEREAQPMAAMPVAAAIPGRATATLSAEQVRTIVREELAAGAEHSAPAVDADPAVVAAREQSLALAHQIVERAIEKGTWSEKDRDALLAAIPDLERAQADEVFSALIPALNDGRLTLTYAGTAL